MQFVDGMDIADLKEFITLERKILNFSDGAVGSICTINSADDAYKMKAGAKLNFPSDGETGSSDDLPFFFTVAKSPTGNSHAVVHHFYL